MSKLPSLAVLVASLAVPANIQAVNIPTQQQERIQNYSVSDIVGLLNKRGKELYFAAENKIVRVRYSSFTQSIIIEIVNDPIAGGELRELSAEDRLRAKLTGDSTSDLYFRCSGNQYGDNDSRDEYSPLNEVPRVGSGIELEGRTQFSRYLQHIGNLLNK